MRNSAYLNNGVQPLNMDGVLEKGVRQSRHLVIGALLLFALLAFEIFNFDTTRFALESLLGDVRFGRLAWATILAIAFCAIDFAGLARLFTPESEKNQSRGAWYLTGAWLLGASMNAIMTWWAVSLTLLNHPLGNEILSREQLLQIVPVFVAGLVWLIRILFIGSLTATGEKILNSRQSKRVPGRRVPDRRTTTGASAANTGKENLKDTNLISRMPVRNPVDLTRVKATDETAGEQSHNRSSEPTRRSQRVHKAGVFAATRRRHTGN